MGEHTYLVRYFPFFLKMNEKKESAKVYFAVSACPQNVFVQFDERTKSEYGDCRWMYIKHLMDVEKQYALLEETVPALWEAIQSLEAKLEASQNKNALSKAEEKEEVQEERKGLGSLIPEKED